MSGRGRFTVDNELSPLVSAGQEASHRAGFSGAHGLSVSTLHSSGKT